MNALFEKLVAHKEAVIAGAVGLVALVLVAVALRCRPAEKVKTVETTKTDAVAQSMSTTATTQAATSSAAATTTVATVAKKKIRTTTTQPSGATTVIEEEDETTTDTNTHRDEASKTDTSTQAKTEQKSETKTETREVTVTVPAGHALGVELGAKWDRVGLSPTHLNLAADVPVGEILGQSIRAGARVESKTENPLKPESVGVYVRGEFF